ncbi:uncharacterized protein LOC116882518 [Lontra canadensis]|uniref:uncharacterized protein LOC116882518 n=1 Tax=Lontra canadensis TaxID=76717 RepID=UPI0013F3419A|nr:uncharacterized protein LOC116882518 [Lontra canadensis]
MVFGLGCQRERLYKPLYIAHLFILAGVVYYYFQGPVGKTAPDHDMAEEPSQLEGETLRPVWGPMDKCYPVTTQRRRVKSGKKQASEAMTPKATGGLSSAAPTEETELWSQREGEVRPPKEEAASLGPVAKEVAEEQEAAGTLGWEVRKPGAPTGTSPALCNVAPVSSHHCAPSFLSDELPPQLLVLRRGPRPRAKGQSKFPEGGELGSSMA